MTGTHRDAAIQACRKVFKQEHEPSNFVPGETYVPPSGKLVDAEDLSFLIEASLDMWLTSGRFAREFEAALPARFGRTGRSILVNSGSSANLLAMSVLGSHKLNELNLRPLQPGDEVITVAAGFPTTVNPILQNGWKPVFVDVDYHTLNALPESVMEARTDKTRAVVLAHTLGNPYRADLLAAWCKKEGLFLVEDCCDALGSTINGQKVGSFGDLSTVSFYPAHHITMGEGGAVTCASSHMYKLVLSLRDWGRDCWCEPGVANTCGKRYNWKLGELPEGYDHKYTYSQIGYNLKVTDMQAALGVSQLKKLDHFVERRKANWKHLHDGIQQSAVLREKLVPVQATPETDPSWFGFPVHCADGIPRDKLVARLEERKVGTRLVFSGNLTRQPAYSPDSYRIHGVLANTDRIMQQTFWVGVQPSLGEPQLSYILEQLEAVLGQV